MISDKKYPSKYSNGKLVSAAQYITEIICEKKAKREKKDLHFRFWTTKEWEMYYRNQIASSHQLLKKYDEVAIIKGLNNPKSEKIYSLRAPHLIPIIEEEQTILNNQNKELSLSLQRIKTEEVEFNRAKSKTNIVSKLKGLDDES
jgi:hypothetical protein